MVTAVLHAAHGRVPVLCNVH